MELQDKVVSIHPYYKVDDKDVEACRKLVDDLIETTRGEMGCLYYGFSFAKGEIHCREGYKNAETLLAHLDNVADLLQRLNSVAILFRIEIHGPSQELAKLQEFEPMKKLSPKYFVLEGGFRN